MKIILIILKIALIILQFYSYFQSKSEFALQLFSSLKPTRVKEMYKIFIAGLNSEIKTRTVFLNYFGNY